MQVIYRNLRINKLMTWNLKKLNLRKRSYKYNRDCLLTSRAFPQWHLGHRPNADTQQTQSTAGFWPSILPVVSQTSETPPPNLSACCREPSLRCVTGTLAHRLQNYCCGSGCDSGCESDSGCDHVCVHSGHRLHYDVGRTPMATGRNDAGCALGNHIGPFCAQE